MAAVAGVPSNPDVRVVAVAVAAVPRAARLVVAEIVPREEEEEAFAVVVDLG